MKRTRRSTQAVTAAVVAMLVAGVTSSSEAVRTRFFTTEGYGDFKKLELAGTELSEDGRIRAGLSDEQIGDLSVRTVWRLVETRNGLAAATGDQGQVFLADDEGTELLATLYNYEMFALAAADDGTIYAAGAPSGSVIAIDRDGKERTIFTAPEGLIFDLTVGPDGTVYVASGERGRIYRVRPDGESDVLAETGDAHVRRMVWSPDRKSLWVGTNGRGLLERIDLATGDVQIVYDAEEEEVVDLLPQPDGSWIFAGNPGPSSPGDGPDDSSGPKPTLYHLTPDGSVRVLWRSSERTIQALLLEADGSVLVATGGAGTVYRVDPSGSEAIVWRAEEDQVVSLIRTSRGLYAGTGNPGRIYRLGPERAETAELVSEVLDAKDQARWGKLSWTTEGRKDAIAFETRSGYTALPDETWTDWAAVTGSGSSGQIPSPPGRYLQWRATFEDRGGDAAVLRSVRAPYLLSNRRPAITRLTLSARDTGFRSERSGGVSQVLAGGVQVDYSVPGAARGGNTLPPEGVPSWVQQLRSIVWSAEDPDSDELTFQIHIRQVGETEFRPVARDLADPAYTLETGLLPNGVYEVRVTASDAGSNAPGEELEAVSVSPPFEVDNLPPSVVDLKARRENGSLSLSGRALDSDSPLRSIAVSIDGGAFRGIHPADGLLDSEEERFDVRLPLEEPDSGNWVVVLARDSAGNEGTYRAWLEP